MKSARRRLAAPMALLVGALAVGGWCGAGAAAVEPGPSFATEADIRQVDAGAAHAGRAEWLRAQLHSGRTLNEIRNYYPTAGLEVPPTWLTAGATLQTGIPRAEMAEALTTSTSTTTGMTPSPSAPAASAAP